MSRSQFKWSGGNDLHFTINCTCPSDKWKDSNIADIMKTDILLSGYADNHFFDVVNEKPRTISCKCGKQYNVQWFRDGVECSPIEKEKVVEQIN